MADSQRNSFIVGYEMDDGSTIFRAKPFSNIGDASREVERLERKPSSRPLSRTPWQVYKMRGEYTFEVVRQ